MKRVRGDAEAQSTAKRSSRPAYPAPSYQAKLTTHDALSYLREVKNRFADNKEVYDTFLEIMKEFKAQRIDTAGVIIRVKQLFRGHRELILGFNTFLPKGYEIELARALSEDDEETLKQPVEFDQAINYVNKIKIRFSQDERVYKAFLEILNMYRKGQKTIVQVYEEVAVLFRNHTDLLDEFTYFLPDNSAPAPGQRPRKPIPPPERRPAGRGAPPVNTLQQDLRQLHKRKAARKAEEGFRRGGLEEEEAPRAKPGVHKELLFFERVRSRLRSRDAFTDFMRVMAMYSADVITRSELLSLVTDLIGKFQDLMSGFHEFLARCDFIDTSSFARNTGAKDSRHKPELCSSSAPIRPSSLVPGPCCRDVQSRRAPGCSLGRGPRMPSRGLSGR
ncbi:MAG: hypothetical protein WDW38_005814 [Sanguina aurantia]